MIDLPFTPDCPDAWLVLADWLDDHGDAEAALAAREYGQGGHITVLEWRDRRMSQGGEPRPAGFDEVYLTDADAALAHVRRLASRERGRDCQSLRDLHELAGDANALAAAVADHSAPRDVRNVAGWMARHRCGPAEAVRQAQATCERLLASPAQQAPSRQALIRRALVRLRGLEAEIRTRVQAGSSR